ncbi:MAG: amidohydrolase family protein [Alphaproteobacteria bacterium]
MNKLARLLAAGTVIATFPSLVHGDEPLPVFDGHVHYNEDATVAYSPARIVEKMHAAGVPRALVSSTSDDNTLALLEEGGPGLVVPFLRPYGGQIHSGNWYRHPDTLAYLQSRWDPDRYAGIGEFHLHQLAGADSAIVRAVAQMTTDAGRMLHVHADSRVIEAIFSHTPDARILWAHAGMVDPPEVIAQTLEAHENLWAEISIRGYEIFPGGAINTDWRELFLAYPDRFLTASDTYVTERWDEYARVIDHHRGWLAQLPTDIARGIAFGNAVRLFGAGGIAVLEK